ncbi:hypothetical protein [Streptomyces sp. NPDC059009]|uniref:hypothetical protein n=1 Tax=Streptomyces sp. NPDC059009 TaxID=3346694 RepID=UPI0036C77E98
MSSTPALAGGEISTDSGATKESGRDRDVGAYAKISFRSSGNAKGGGPITSVDTNWTPPPCWYAPEWKASEFRGYRDRLYYGARHDPGAPRDALNEMSDENQKYAKDNYNIDKEKEGMWWGAQFSPDATLEEQQKCSKPPFWVKNGEKPDVENVIDAEVLANLAYNHIKVPGTKVTLAPDGPSKVNMPTWAWLDKANFKPVSVTASLDAGDLHIEATTTATPSSLTFKPGTEDATIHPASGECAVNKDGSIGEPYAKGKANQTPPCGVTYLRSSGNGTFNLQATAVWKISWTGTGQDKPVDLPNGEYGNNQPVTVEEAQAVNR